MAIPVTGYAHVRLTVTDIARSRAFYDTVFGFDVAYEVPEDADAETRERLAFVYGGVIYAVPGGAHFGLRPVAPDGDRFDEDRVGLDHVSFRVPSKADLEATVKVLDSIGAVHSGVKDIGVVLLLEFRDPDNIAVELTAPPE
jgi:glyoxylase I family protein